jgi:hypothetical protein
MPKSQTADRLAGVGVDAVRKATGKGWADWIQLAPISRVKP